MGAYNKDRTWSDQYLPEVIQILTALTGKPVRVSTDYEDQKQATDLVVLSTGNLKIACRLRRPQYLRYADEFTLRSGREGGATTELEKIEQGFGDYLFYGFLDDGGKIAKWYLLNLHAFRAALVDELLGFYSLDAKIKDNYDGTRFKVYRFANFPNQDSLIVAQNGNGTMYNSVLQKLANLRVKANQLVTC